MIPIDRKGLRQTHSHERYHGKANILNKFACPLRIPVPSQRTAGGLGEQRDVVCFKWHSAWNIISLVAARGLPSRARCLPEVMAFEFNRWTSALLDARLLPELLSFELQAKADLSQ